MMRLQRDVQPEILDFLSKEDPRAVRSRADLRRINRIMGSRTIMLHGLPHAIAVPRRIIELGAGDGTLLLRVAKRLVRYWPDVQLILLDRQNLVAPHTIAAFHALGWQAKVVVADALAWLTDLDPSMPEDQRFDLAISNLFIHHFDGPQLALLLAALSKRADAFFASEPRRAWLSLIGSYLTGLVGANSVTREDAVSSVRAGFAHDELSMLWRTLHGDWHLQEYPAGLFNHCFFAIRKK